MNKNDEQLERNISRLIKLMKDSEKPGEAFAESLTKSAIAKLSPKEERNLKIRTIKNGLLSLGAAAVFLVAVGLFISGRGPVKQNTAVASKPACQMMSMLELNFAYRRGGMEAVDEQFEKAYSKLGSKDSISINDLFNTL
jgi:hypothetical protein